MIDAVYFDGSAVELDTIAYDVGIIVGRRDTTTTYAPSSCRITFYDVVADSYTALVGKTLVIAGNAYCLFAGYITDVRLTVATATSGARCDIIAAGPSSRLGLIQAGASGYAAHTLEDRLDAIATEATSQGGFDFSDQTGTDEGAYTLSAYTAGATTATSLFQEFLEPYGGCLYDLPDDGSIYVPTTTGKIAYYTADLAPDDFYGQNLNASLTLFAPVFDQSGQIINDVVITYDTGTVTRSNAESQLLYGKRTRSITTTIDNATNARDLGDEIISRARRPRWNISEVVYEQSTIGPEILYPRIGNEITVNDLPTGSPTTTYVGIVQGWEHKISQQKFRTTFYVADPAELGYGIPWEKIPQTASYQWDSINHTVIWDNALTLADLTA